MKRLRKIINYILWIVVAIYFAIAAMLHIPVFQSFIGSEVASALATKLGTKVEVGRVDLGFLNRLVIDDVHIYDQKGKPMLMATRMSAKADILPLFEGKISISSAQLFGLNANLYRTAKDAPTNFQFVLDSLSSKDNSKHTPLNLQITSLVIRNGKARWNDYEPRNGEGLDIHHLDVSDLSAHVLLNHLTDDGIDITVKRFALKEASGIDLRQLAFKAKTSQTRASVTNLTIELPGTKITFPSIVATYRKSKKGLDKHSLRYNINLAQSHIAPADLAFLDPTLKTFHNRINVKALVTGTANSIDLKDIALETDDQSIIVRGNGSVANLGGKPRWAFRANSLRTSADGIQYVARNLRKHKINMPQEIIRLGNIYFKGAASGEGKHIAAKGNIETGAGNAFADITIDGGHFGGKVRTDGFELGRILDNKDFGHVVADVTAKGFIPSPFSLDKLDVTAKALIGQFDYKQYPYRNVSVDGTFRNSTFNGIASIDDPNGKLRVEGTINREKVLATINAQNVNPYRLKLTQALGNRTFSVSGKANLIGKDLDHLYGSVDLNNFSAIGEGKNYRVNTLHAAVNNDHRHRTATVASDFGEVAISGIYDYPTLPNSFTSIIGHHLPSLFASRQKGAGNAFSVHGRLVDASILRELFGIPLSVNGPVDINGTVNDQTQNIDLQLDAPHIIYSGNNIHDAHITVGSNAQSMTLMAQGKRISEAGTPLSVTLNASAHDDAIILGGQWDIKGAKHHYGDLNTSTTLFRTPDKGLGFNVNILPSEEVFDTIHVAVQPSHLTYQHNLLDIDHFEVSNRQQHVTINGQTTGSAEDSLLVDFKNINLKYVLDLVGFDAVSFTGDVTGKGYVKSFFKSPQATADFDVNDFRFQGGEFGTLRAHATYDNNTGRINVNSRADDGPDHYTDINGYVSIKDNYIDMPMQAHGTSLEFVQGFANAVLTNTKATGTGWCRLYGNMSHLNLEGDMYGDGDMTIKQTNTTYTMRHSPIHMVPNEIEFLNDTVYDKDGNPGIITGALHHKELHKMTFDIHVEANKLMCLNLPEFGDNSFRGIIYGSGQCDIIGRSGETTINANLTPVGKSYMEYNVGSSGSLDDNSFIHWHDITDKLVKKDSVNGKDYLAINADSTNSPSNAVSPSSVSEDIPDIPSDFTMNILVNTTPDFTLRVLMDPTTGDHMDFHGNGVIRSTYFNKGAFQMFGNYNIDFGNYTMTIQNLVKKNFTFEPGSSITFGGNPFDARLNIKAMYTVNGVSLSDLQMGRSFTSSNIRVNCLMNIGGTPLKPAVTFDIDLPTLSTDAQQMVRSVMNSEEDMNQQVLYLLAVGRFYNPGNNNAEVESNASQSQTSLAMQSVLSGALSQQLSNVMSSVIHNTNWNVGANISTGEEGWSDAEYEGLLSGRMLNNRLFFQGQFGYRDKVTTNNSSFIGDFDLRYLLTPNGNVAVRVYNQTNDRYFTRNSLTTQGLGFVLKKDFSGWRDLFGIGKKKNKDKKTKSKDKKEKKSGKKH